jgi:hypothetical protein
MLEGRGRARGRLRVWRLWALVLLTAVGCDHFVAYRLWDGTPRFRPYTGIKKTGETLTLTVEQGKRPYSFKLVAGEGSIRAVGDSQVEYAAPPAPTQARIRVTDALASSAEAEIQVVGDPLVITPADVDVPVNGTHRFTASGGVPPRSFSVSAGYGGTIDPVTGWYLAPAAAGEEEVTATDSKPGSPQQGRGPRARDGITAGGKRA